jgi:hypothetical protein
MLANASAVKALFPFLHPYQYPLINIPNDISYSDGMGGSRTLLLLLLEDIAGDAASWGWVVTRLRAASQFTYDIGCLENSMCIFPSSYREQ